MKNKIGFYISILTIISSYSSFNYLATHHLLCVWMNNLVDSFTMPACRMWYFIYINLFNNFYAKTSPCIKPSNYSLFHAVGICKLL